MKSGHNKNSFQLTQTESTIGIYSHNFSLVTDMTTFFNFIEHVSKYEMIAVLQRNVFMKIRNTCTAIEIAVSFESNKNIEFGDA